MCSICKEPVIEETSWKCFGPDFIDLTDPGKCIGCEKSMCNLHSYQMWFDDDTGGYENLIYCIYCVQKHNDVIEKDARKWDSRYLCFGKIIAFIKRLNRITIKDEKEKVD